MEVDIIKIGGHFKKTFNNQLRPIERLFKLEASYSIPCWKKWVNKSFTL